MFGWSVPLYHPLAVRRNYTVSQKKNDTDLARYNSDVRQPILRNFDKTVAERVGYQNDLFLTSPN